MSIRSLPGGKGQLVCKAYNPTAICEPIFYRKCGSFSFSQHFGPSGPVTGIDLPFFFSSDNPHSSVDLISQSLQIGILYTMTGTLNVSQPYRPSWPVTGIALLFTL
jgi:hypothetical protein